MEQLRDSIISSLFGDIGFLQTEVSNLFKKKESLLKEISLEGVKFEEKKKEYDDRIDSLRKSINELRREASSVVVLIEDKKRYLCDIEANINSINNLRNTDSIRLNYLESQKEAVEIKIKELRDFIKSQLDTIENHNNLIKQQHNNINSLEYVIIKLQKDKLKLENDLSNLSINISTLETDRDKFKEEVIEFEKEKNLIIEREKNVSRQEIMQAGRVAKSTLKIIKEKIDGV